MVVHTLVSSHPSIPTVSLFETRAECGDEGDCLGGLVCDDGVCTFVEVATNPDETDVPEDGFIAVPDVLENERDEWLNSEGIRSLEPEYES